MRFILVLLITSLPLFTLSAKYADTINSASLKNTIREYPFNEIVKLDYVNHGSYINLIKLYIGDSVDESEITDGILSLPRFKKYTEKFKTLLLQKREKRVIDCLNFG